MGMYFSAILCYIARHVDRWSGLKRLSLALLLSAGIIVPLAHQTPAHADGSTILCRSDPVLVVNGAVIDVASTLWSDPSAVQEIDYQVTVPSGSLIGGVTLTVGLGFPEKVSYVFSPTQPWGSVQVAASVVTQNGVAPFPVSVQVSSLLAGTNTASGTSDATTTISLNHLLML